MSSLLEGFPLELMNPAKKYAVMNYLVGLGVPARIARTVLQQWGEAMNVQIDPSDYTLVENKMKVVKG